MSFCTTSYVPVRAVRVECAAPLDDDVLQLVPAENQQFVSWEIILQHKQSHAVAYCINANRGVDLHIKTSLFRRTTTGSRPGVRSSGQVPSGGSAHR